MVRKILVVDDEKEDLETMKSILESNDYEVIATKDGKEALEIIQEKSDEIKLILLDILMPTLTGYGLLKIIREKINHDVKLLYVSIVPKQEVDMRDVDGFIQKPFSPETFLQKIKDVLQ